MSIIYMLLTISVIVALVFFVAFIVSVKRGQYDDTYTPSVRMLFEDELVSDTASDIVAETVSETDSEAKKTTNQTITNDNT